VAVMVLHCSDMLLGTRQRINQPLSLTQYGGRIIVPECKGRVARIALTLAITAGALIFSGLRNDRLPLFTTSGNVSEPLAERPGHWSARGRFGQE
jgi:hypothetical protein